MKTLQVMLKTLRELWREPQVLGLYLAFPALMIMIYFVAFGQQGGMARMLTLAIDNQDQGPLGAELVKQIQNAVFDGQPVFTIRPLEADGVTQIALDERKLTGVLVIPPNFSSSFTAGGPAARLELRGDRGSDMTIFAASFLSDLVSAFSDAQHQWKAGDPVRIEFLPGTGKMSDFQFGVPGVMMFSVMFGAIVTALAVTREQTAGTLARLRMTRLSAGSMAAGLVLSQAALAAAQIPLAFGVACLFGFSSPGSLPLATLVGVILSFSATGIGLLAACISKSNGDAANYGTALMMPAVFLSGGIFPMPEITVGNFLGRAINLYDILPTTHASEALRRILIFGEGAGAVGYELGMLLFLSLVLLAGGAALYQHLKLSQNTKS